MMAATGLSDSCVFYQREKKYVAAFLLSVVEFPQSASRE
jgi:hypothetical protein